MPFYTIECPLCGPGETRASMSDAAQDLLRCACGTIAPQRFTPDHFLGMRIDAGGENISDPARVRDGSSTYNAGLPGIETVVGKRRDGKNKTTYRPVSHAELGSNRGVREYAKKHGLTPIEGGRYRSGPR